MDKFNKQNVSDFINKQIEILEKENGFKEGQGRSQLSRGEDVDIIVAYGRYEALKDLHYDLFNNDKRFY